MRVRVGLSSRVGVGDVAATPSGAQPSCPSGSTPMGGNSGYCFDSSGNLLPSQPTCSVGVYNPINNNCVSCPSGTQLNAFTGSCVGTPAATPTDNTSTVVGLGLAAIVLVLLLK
jgi:hypothetical protein